MPASAKDNLISKPRPRPRPKPRAAPAPRHAEAVFDPAEDEKIHVDPAPARRLLVSAAAAAALVLGVSGGLYYFVRQVRASASEPAPAPAPAPAATERVAFVRLEKTNAALSEDTNDPPVT